MSSEVYTSRFNRRTAVALWVVEALLALDLARTGDLLPALPGFVLAAYLLWLVLWRPHVVVDAEGTQLHNVLRTVVVPWEALIHVETKYALTLRTARAAHSAWAAPAPARPSSVRRQREVRKPRPGEAGVRPGDLRGTSSGDAAHLVRERWEHLLATGGIEAGRAEEVHEQVRWHVPELAVAGVLLAATVVLPGLL
ncbi:PH domain-containing protein [Nocardioides zeae]|uniref:PH domain-containing protein n=1 Tax=Nocardioides imazamoxiresistens TaxID=3231893 RepID=A0ABU3PXC5_9ACTN|nr:PH domain-containing protein [Nocardioides zeae]MDT9593885.1 PH domain-containing protein [Nocardioides zeae]